MCVRALVLLVGGVLSLCVLDPVLCAGDVVLIVGLCIFFLILCLATVDCSTLVTTGVDTSKLVGLAASSILFDVIYCWYC